VHVEVEVVCAPHPRQEVEAALRSAGEQLTLTAESVSVEVRPTGQPTAPSIAVLAFEMRRAVQYKVVDDIYRTVKHWAWQFYEDITIRFPKD
jgi:hypothetical protein